MKFQVEEKKLVMWVYFLVMALLMTAINDKMVFAGLINKLKYVYILFMIFINFYDGFTVWSKRAVFGILLLVIHTVLFGLGSNNPRVEYLTNVHFQQLVTYLLMSMLTLIYVVKKRCFNEFIKASYWSIVAMFFFATVTHLGHFVNPVYFVNIFSRYERFRADFGLGDVNYCGNYALYALILSFFLFVSCKKKNVELQIYEKWCMLGADLVILCVIFSTASRSAILSFAIMVGLYYVFENMDWVVKHGKVIFGLGGSLLLIAVVILSATGTLSQIWTDSNREGNFSINYPIFLEYGNYLMGMGYIDNSGYLNMEFGYATTAMDVYYLYIIFSTGIIGAVLIFGQMLYLLIHLIKYKNVPGRNLALSLFLMMLFYAVWQVNYMNYRYYTGIIHFVILFYFVWNTEKKNTVIQLKENCDG